MPIYYPPVGFHFRVEVLLDPPASDYDIRFSDVSGLSVEVVTEEVAEGGENRYVQKYPTRAKYPELVLKRGLLPDSEVAKWVRRCVEHLLIEPKDVNISLLNEAHEPLMTWQVVGAYPTRWSVSDLSASSNTIVIESLQMSYQYFTLKGAEGNASDSR
jgi:phage tail-like protein